MVNELFFALFLVLLVGWFVVLYFLIDWAFFGRKKYETLDLSKISDDDCILIGHDYKKLSMKHSIVLHNRLADALIEARRKGNKIVKVDLDGYCVKTIKKQDATQNSNMTIIC